MNLIVPSPCKKLLLLSRLPKTGLTRVGDAGRVFMIYALSCGIDPAYTGSVLQGLVLVYVADRTGDCGERDISTYAMSCGDGLRDELWGRPTWAVCYKGVGFLRHRNDPIIC